MPLLFKKRRHFLLLGGINYEKNFAFVLAAILLLSGCGEDETNTKILPLELSVKSALANEMTVLAENFGEEKIKVDGASLYQLEDGKEIEVGNYVRFIDKNLEYSVSQGETAEWFFDIENLFGKISAGKYKMTFGGFEYGDNYNGNWYKEIEFEIGETKTGPETLDVTAESIDCWNRAVGATIFNSSDREIQLSAMWELYYEVDGKFEKLNYVRGIGYDKTMQPIAPGESYESSHNTEGIYGLFPHRKYRQDYRIVFTDDAGNEREQTVSAYFEITGLEETGASFLWDKSAELSGTVITLTFRNHRGHEIRYGEDYFIQRLEGEDWVTVEPMNEPAFDTVLYTLDEFGDKFVEWSADLSLIYGELPEGKYRLVKTIFADAKNYINGKHYAFFKFDIE